MAESKFAPVSRRDSLSGKRRLDGETTNEKFADLTRQSTAFEAKWFLKAYWGSPIIDVNDKQLSGPIKDNLEIAEHVFSAFLEIKKRRKDGEDELRQLEAHHFLEKMGEAITYTKFKEKFNQLDIDFNGRLSISEYLVHHFNLAVPGNLTHIEKMCNKKFIEIAGLADAQAAMDEAQNDMDAVKKAKAEVDEVMALIQKQKMNHKIKADQMQKKIDKVTKQGSAVKAGIHMTKLRVHMNNNPVDNKTELTQKAAVRRMRKAYKAARHALDEAEAIVEKFKSSGQQAGATIWWMERNLKEMEKTMSKKAFARKMNKIQKKKEKAEADQKALDALRP